MMTEMIERVARALYYARSDPDREWEDATEEAKYPHRHDATAAIEAMRDPTLGMCAAAHKHHEGASYLPHSLWNSMLSAALEPTKASVG